MRVEIKDSNEGEKFSFEVDHYWSQNACRDKIAFSTLKIAKQEAKRLTKHFKVEFSSYRCWSCKKFHNGRLQDKYKRRKERHIEDE